VHLSEQGARHPVLFLHGIPTSSRLWGGVIERMSDQFQCIAVDLPGLGRTAGTSRGFRDLAALAARLDEIRIQCGVEKWHVVGHDAGCAIAVHYAHRFPDRTGRLALLSPFLLPELKPFHLFEILRKPVIGEMMAPLINLLFWKVAMRRVASGNRDLNEIVRDFEAPFGGLRGSWRLMSLLRWGNPADVLASIPSLLAEISAPALIFHGSRDPVVPEAFARRVSDLVPDSELILLDSGHFLPLHEPRLIARELMRFFHGQDQPEVCSMAFAVQAHFGLNSGGSRK
jgi:haloalkane dehalogenase